MLPKKFRNKALKGFGLAEKKQALVFRILIKAGIIHFLPGLPSRSGFSTGGRRRDHRGSLVLFQGIEAVGSAGMGRGSLGFN